LYIVIRFKDKGEIIAKIGVAELVELLPLTGVVNVWKEEVYFNIGVDLKGELVSRVKPGTVAYWPPGKALCLFYGINQPYSPVIVLGELLGPLYYLTWVESGEEVEVVKYRDYGRAGSIAAKLRKNGVDAASRAWEDYQSVVVLSGGVRLEIFVEDYGFYLETEPLFHYDKSAISMGLIQRLRSLISGEYARLDLNEEGYVVISGVTTNPEELVSAIRELSSLWLKFVKVLENFNCLKQHYIALKGLKK